VDKVELVDRMDRVEEMESTFAPSPFRPFAQSIGRARWALAAEGGELHDLFLGCLLACQLAD
jgi:hypothetical protein